MHKYFTTGEFARICNTTRETLFHYDEIGLLKPMYVGDNKYRYYSAKQFYLFDLIDTLRHSGCSLAEIKEYTQSYDPQSYKALLDRCYEKLEQKRREIEQILKIVGNTREGVQEALRNRVDEPYLEYCEEEYLIATPVNARDELDEVYALQDHFAYCSEHQIGDEFPIGSIFMEKDLQKEHFYESYYYTRIAEPTESTRLFKKPAGRYAAMYHRGSYNALPEAFRRLIDYVRAQGYDVGGNGYIHELLSYLASSREHDYVFKVSLAVKRPSIR